MKVVNASLLYVVSDRKGNLDSGRLSNKVDFKKAR